MRNAFACWKRKKQDIIFVACVQRIPFFTYIYTFPHSSSLSEADNATARLNKWRIERVCFCRPNHRLALQTDRQTQRLAGGTETDGRTDHRRSRSALLAYSSARLG